MIVYGKQVCLYVLEKHNNLINEIYFGKEIDKAIFNKFAALNKPIIKPDPKKMQSLAKGGNHQGFPEIVHFRPPGLVLVGLH